MPSDNPQIAIPDSLTTLLANPERIRDALVLLNALLAGTVTLATPVQAGGRSKLRVTEQGSELVLALRWPSGVPSDLAGGASLPDVVAKVNLILAGERAVQSGGQ